MHLLFHAHANIKKLKKIIFFLVKEQKYFPPNK